MTILVIFLIFIVIIVAINIHKRIKYASLVKDKGPRGITVRYPKLVALGLAEFIKNITKTENMFKTNAERNEIHMFLLGEIDRLLFVHYPQDRDMIFDYLAVFLLDKNLIDTYNERSMVYYKCKELIGKTGATVGTRLFGLSHYLQQARGKTSGKDMTQVITGERNLELNETKEFIDIFEGMQLSFFITNALVSLKDILGKLENLG